MNIAGFSLSQINELVIKYVAAYFADCEIIIAEYGLLEEAYTFEFHEIEHMIPTHYHSQYCWNDKFIGSSGCLHFTQKTDRFVDGEYVIIFIANEEYTKAIALYLQDTTTEEYVLLKDFQYM